MAFLDIIMISIYKRKDIVMNKTELINVVAAETEAQKKVVEAIINATFKAIADAMKEGDKVSLIGFGTFEVKDTAEREGRNPKTGETIKIAAAKKPVFTASKVLKDEVNA